MRGIRRVLVLQEWKILLADDASLGDIDRVLHQKILSPGSDNFCFLFYRSEEKKITLMKRKWSVE